MVISDCFNFTGGDRGTNSRCQSDYRQGGCQYECRYTHHDLTDGGEHSPCDTYHGDENLSLIHI